MVGWAVEPGKGEMKLAGRAAWFSPEGGEVERAGGGDEGDEVDGDWEGREEGEAMDSFEVMKLLRAFWEDLEDSGRPGVSDMLRILFTMRRVPEGITGGDTVVSLSLRKVEVRGDVGSFGDVLSCQPNSSKEGSEGQQGEGEGEGRREKGAINPQMTGDRARHERTNLGSQLGWKGPGDPHLRPPFPPRCHPGRRQWKWRRQNESPLKAI